MNRNIPAYLTQMQKRLAQRYGSPQAKQIAPFVLEPVQQEWVDWAFSGGERLLLGARGYGKTESIILCGLLSRILQDKTTTARLYTRNYEDAKDLLRVLGSLLKQAGCRGVFSATQIILAQNKSKEPTLSLKSILGKGHKGKHVDWVILDDPVDLMDEFSAMMVQRVNRIYQNLSSIAKKGVITIGQYVCSGDLYTQLEKTIPTRGYWHGALPSRDVDLDSLRASGKSEAFIQANYCGQLLPSAVRPFEKILLGDFDDRFDSACLDPSLTGGDYTALSLMRLEGSHIIVRIYLWKQSYVECFNSVVQILQKMRVRVFHYEDNIIGDSAYFTFKTITGLAVYPFRSTQNKVHKILKLQSLITPNAYTSFKLVFDKASDPLALEQIQFWSPLKNMHDDAPDSVAMLLQQEGLLDL